MICKLPVCTQLCPCTRQCIVCCGVLIARNRPSQLQGESVLDLYDAIALEEVPYPRSQPISYELQVGQLH